MLPAGIAYVLGDDVERIVIRLVVIAVESEQSAQGGDADSLLAALLYLGCQRFARTALREVKSTLDAQQLDDGVG